MKKIFVCSPLRGDQRQNEVNTERYCKFVINSGHAPYAPHLLFTRFLDDNNDKERRLGIEAGMRFLSVCDELWCFGDKITFGMKAEINYCMNNLIPVKFITVTEDEKGEFWYSIKGEQ